MREGAQARLIRAWREGKGKNVECYTLKGKVKSVIDPRDEGWVMVQ